jgi:hypothetical protein
MMLQGALFADAMGRDLMPDLYPPPRRAAAAYARLFLRMLGAEGDDAGPGMDQRLDGQENAGHGNGGRAATRGKRRTGQDSPARPPRGT